MLIGLLYILQYFVSVVVSDEVRHVAFSVKLHRVLAPSILFDHYASGYIMSILNKICKMPINYEFDYIEKLAACTFPRFNHIICHYDGGRLTNRRC